MAFGSRHQPRRPWCSATRALLRTRSADIESRALPGRVGEEAWSHEWFDAIAAMAAGRAMACMPGRHLEATGTAVGQEQRDARDDHAGARRVDIGMGSADCGGGRGVAVGSYGCRRRAAYAEYAECGAAGTVCDCVGGRVGAVREANAGDG